jgi:hypothetical protein
MQLTTRACGFREQFELENRGEFFFSNHERVDAWGTGSLHTERTKLALAIDLAAMAKEAHVGSTQGSTADAFTVGRALSMARLVLVGVAMPSAYNLHPEFGYFCLSPRLRRIVRFGLALIVLGSIAVASQTVVQIADREPGFLDGSATSAIPLEPGTVSPTASPASTAALAESRTSPPVRVASPVSPAVRVESPTAPAVSTRSQSDLALATPIDATALATASPSQQKSIARSKKPRKTVRNNNRRRDRDLYDAYAWRPPPGDYRSRRFDDEHFWRPRW